MPRPAATPPTRSRLTAPHRRRTQSPLKRPIAIASEKQAKPVAAPSIPAPAHSRKKTAVQSPMAPSAIRARNASAPKADQGARRPRQHTDPIGAGDLTAQQGSRGGEQHRSNNDGQTQRLDGSRDTAPDGERRYARRGQTTGAVETVQRGENRPRIAILDQPEIECVAGELASRKAGQRPMALAAEHRRVGLAQHLDMPEREILFLRAEVEVVEPQGLLKATTWGC